MCLKKKTWLLPRISGIAGHLFERRLILSVENSSYETLLIVKATSVQLFYLATTQSELLIMFHYPPCSNMYQVAIDNLYCFRNVETVIYPVSNFPKQIGNLRVQYILLRYTPYANSKEVPGKQKFLRISLIIIFEFSVMLTTVVF